jgi:ABC-type phosphate transport system permease subunit
MRVWFLLFTVNIQNQRENFGMMRTLMSSIFLTLLPLQIQKMRELARILFLREMILSRLLKEWLCLLLRILAGGHVVLHGNIHLLGGFVERMVE